MYFVYFDGQNENYIGPCEKIVVRNKNDSPGTQIIHCYFKDNPEPMLYCINCVFEIITEEFYKG